MKHDTARDPDFSLDKSAFSVVPLSASDDDAAYWRTRTPLERLEAIEIMRQILYGYDPATERLQRVLEVVQQAPRGTSSE
jgi:hypothetical protein